MEPNERCDQPGPSEQPVGTDPALMSEPDASTASCPLASQNPGLTREVTEAWSGFAHPTQKIKDYEGLRRHLRYTSIELNKLWVEIQSCPVFLNTDKTYSVHVVEQLIQWLQACPAWSELIKKSSVIPELANPASRKRLLGFARDLMSARALRAILEEKFEGQISSQLLRSAIEPVRLHHLESWTRPELDPGIGATTTKLKQAERIREFFTELSLHASAPAPATAPQAMRVLLMLERARQIPPSIRAWRGKPVLEPASAANILKWQQKAKPLVELRAELASKFILERAPSPEELRKTATALRQTGALYAFRKDYREASKTYLAFLQGSKKRSIEPRQQKAELLETWATYLESLTSFNGEPEALSLFEANFRGIDTDFESALAANRWAAVVRQEFRSVAPLTGSVEPSEPREQSLEDSLASFLLAAPESELDFASSRATTDQARVVKALVSDSDFDQKRPIDETILAETAQLAALVQLRGCVETLGLRHEIPLATIEQMLPMAEELEFLARRMGASARLSPYLKTHYAGMDTKLDEIELCLDYVKFIDAAQIPATLKTALLAAPGPSRLADTRDMVLQAVRAMSTVQDHLRRLDAMTHGQTRDFLAGKSIEEVPIPVALKRIQEALNTALPASMIAEEDPIEEFPDEALPS